MKFKQEINFSGNQNELSISLSELDKKETKMFIKINEKNEEYIDLDSALPDMTHAEAAEYLFVKPGTLKNYREKCKIPSYTKDGRRFYKTDDLDKFLKNRKHFIDNNQTDSN